MIGVVRYYYVPLLLSIVTTLQPKRHDIILHILS